MNKVDKITIKSTFNKKEDFKPLIGKDILIFAGQAVGYKVHNHPTYGESIGLIGAFVCINLITGEQVESQMIYPTKSLAMSIHDRITKGEAIVEFKAKISVAASDKSPLGYAWVETPMLDADTVSRHQELVSSVVAESAKYLALAAPVAAPVAATKKAK